MDMLEYAYKSIKRYNPYKDLEGFKYTGYYEQKFIEYLEGFKNNHVEVLKEKLYHQHDEEIDKFFAKIIRKRNNQEIDRILHEHSDLMFDEFDFDNEEVISDLKRKIRQVKDMILVSEPTDMKRLQKVDDEVGEAIDEVSLYFNVSGQAEFDGIRISELFQYFNPSADLSLEEYSEYVFSFKMLVEDICEHYRKNYSVKTATKYIKDLKTVTDNFIRQRNEKIDVLSMDEKTLQFLSAESYLEWQRILMRCRSMNRDATLSDYDTWISDFRSKIDKYKSDIVKRYTSDVANKMINMVDEKTGELIDEIAKSVGYNKNHKSKLQEIFNSYKPEDIDIFDMMFYSSEEDRNESYKEYQGMTEEEKNAFEMRIYDQYVRMFKGKVREFNKDVRRVYSLKYAKKTINQINKRADKLISDRAREIGKPVPKNPWFARKYLWADTENFMSDNGLKLRQMINPVMRNAVRFAMNNKLIIEERSKLDSTKQYIFVPTHYFTEDAIGMFASLDRQAYMLMGTTDQIENNPLMLAAVMFGFFHVDRMDNTNRRECIDKQNRIIDYGANFINYVSGSWENSENELQPLSFSGPHRTSAQKGVEIVPVGLYLVREEKKIYVRYGDPMDLINLDEKKANEMIRDTLATIHFKQMAKHSVPIETIWIGGYGETHNLPYDQHTYYMEQVANEYWNQPWSRPFAVEEIGLRPKKVTDEADVYSFIDNLSREKLIEMSSVLAEPLLRMDEKQRYDMIDYIDRNYARLKDSKTKRKVKKEN